MNISKEDSVMSMFRLDDRVALITGGSKGLGKSITLGLAQAGAKTVICSRHQDECDSVSISIEKQTGIESIGISMDVTDPEQVEDTFDKVMEKFGSLDVLVNSAGINIRNPIEELSLDEFRQVINTNLTGSWLCCKASASVMKKQKRGSVINIGSTLSVVGVKNRTPYCSSKAGILGLTRALALEWAAFGARCNAICPGPFLTEMNQPLLNQPKKAEAIISKTAFNRWGQLHEIRGAALFLASDASSYVTGTALFVDGGWTVG
ncbi:SDR family oxidoreductase [Candidatus Poribacteria bacterium]|nr:SDR family oxidoreductase [Candidatus Poribacteria bacterium]